MLNMSEQVNHPDHYNDYPMEVIDMMVAIYGKEDVAKFCEINAFKYRMRLFHKSDAVVDFDKEQWYLNKRTELLKEERDEESDRTNE